MVQKTNIIDHISDDARYVLLKTDKTTIPKQLKTVQEAIEFLGPHAFKTPGLPTSSPQSPGTIKIASKEDVMAGIDNTTAITPYLLKYRLDRPEATETVFGITRYATNAEAKAGTLDTRSITPKKLKYVIGGLVSSESVIGMAKIATLDMAKFGTDDKTIMTPKKVKHAITLLSPSEGLATEKSQGVVVLATTAQTQSGTSREGLAVSPYGFINSRASTTKVGTTRLATSTEMIAGTDNTVAVTPKLVMALRGSDTSFGLLKISNTKTTSPNTALAANANVLYTSGGETTGRITLNGRKYVTEDELGTGGLELGMITFSAVVPNSKSDYVLCDGRSLSTKEYPALFNAIKYTFGGSGDAFNVPDMRGLFVRGVGKGNNITGALGSEVTASRLGDIQQQQVRKHKHAGFGTAGHNDFEPPFGLSSNKRWKGASNSHHGSRAYYTNNGTEDLTGNEWPINPDKTVGNETRPWNISLYYVIKAK